MLRNINGEIMEHIFLPVDNISDFACYSVYDKDTIRAYKTMPHLDSSSDYIDFYINSHYLEKSGTQRWGSWSDSLPSCLSTSVITNDIYYRTDLKDSLLIFVLLVLIIFWIPFRFTVGRLFKNIWR